MAVTRKILEMGSIVMDHTMYVDELPTVGLSMMTDNFHRFPGGKGSNQAITASRFGADVRFIGHIGIDPTSKEMESYLVKEGVDLSNMFITPDTTVGMAIVLVDREGKNYVVFNPAATLRLTPENIEEKKDIFVKDDVFVLTMEFKIETVYAAIRRAHKNGMFIVLDPLAVPISSFPEDILPMIDVMKPNETEASALTGINVQDKESATEAVKILHRAGVTTPVVSLGEQGLVTIKNDEIIHIPGLPVKAIDSTGAGDVFIGAFAAEYSKTGDLLRALKIANVSAALSTTIMGAQTSIPHAEDVYAIAKERGVFA